MAKTRRTWQPKKLKRIRKHGFMKRMATVGGRRVIKARKLKGRKVLAVAYNGKVTPNFSVKFP